MNLGLTDLSVALDRTALALLALCVAWGAAVLSAVLAEAFTRGRIRFAGRLGCPAGLHRLLLSGAAALLGLLGVLGPIGAATGAPHPDHAVPHELPAAPDRPTDPPSRDRHAGAVSLEVRVRAGDSLWTICRDLLPPATPATAVAEAVRTAHQRNRDVIGSDPDLILPGQVLEIPGAVTRVNQEVLR